ncbi:MAG: copper transport protein [Actinomycetota bacterium]|nr:copper transport protein [Actinomycetota bacterium]
MVLAVVLGTATPASAHAILLRTEPGSQTTVTEAPAAVKLHFSEPVEAAFGAIRVFDVDGHRVDSGRLTRADGGREVDVPVARLRDGTYNLTWRVVSADGHPVHGGFGFYVGAPSSISAVAISPEAVASRVVGWGYGAVRFAWFAGLLSLVGMVVTRRWVWTPALRSAGLAESDAAIGFRRRFARALAAAVTVMALAGVLTLVFQAASISGLSLASSARPDVLGQVLTTEFGRLWILQMTLTAAMVLPVVAIVGRRRLLGMEPGGWATVLLVLAAGASVATALNGHARTLGHPIVGVTSVALHLVAVGVWVGGLGTLLALAGPGWRSLPPDARPSFLLALITRFSRIAIAAVAVVIATGVLNAVLDLASVSDLWTTDYGRVILAKVALLAFALALAARHRWSTPRRLLASAEHKDDDKSDGVPAVTAFDRSAAVELAALVAAVGLAAALVALVPGRSLAEAANGPVNLERRAGAYTVQLFIDPTQVGSNEVHVTFVDPQGLGAAGVSNVQVTVGPEGAEPQPVAMRLISPGHFVGDTTLPAPGSYRLQTSAGPDATTTFTFRLRGTPTPTPTPTPTKDATPP